MTKEQANQLTEIYNAIQVIKLESPECYIGNITQTNGWTQKTGNYPIVMTVTNYKYLFVSAFTYNTGNNLDYRLWLDGENKGYFTGLANISDVNELKVEIYRANNYSIPTGYTSICVVASNNIELMDEL